MDTVNEEDQTGQQVDIAIENHTTPQEIPSHIEETNQDSVDDSPQAGHLPSGHVQSHNPLNIPYLYTAEEIKNDFDKYMNAVRNYRESVPYNAKLRPREVFLLYDIVLAINRDDQENEVFLSDFEAIRKHWEDKIAKQNRWLRRIGAGDKVQYKFWSPPSDKQLPTADFYNREFRFHLLLPNENGASDSLSIGEESDNFNPVQNDHTSPWVNVRIKLGTKVLLSDGNKLCKEGYKTILEEFMHEGDKKIQFQPQVFKPEKFITVTLPGWIKSFTGMRFLNRIAMAAVIFEQYIDLLIAYESGLVVVNMDNPEEAIDKMDEYWESKISISNRFNSNMASLSLPEICRRLERFQIYQPGQFKWFLNPKKQGLNDITIPEFSSDYRFDFTSLFYEEESYRHPVTFITIKGRDTTYDENDMLWAKRMWRFCKAAMNTIPETFLAIAHNPETISYSVLRRFGLENPDKGFTIILPPSHRVNVEHNRNQWIRRRDSKLSIARRIGRQTTESIRNIPARLSLI
ncbi:hypothetical protein EDC01DRAFT_630909 [Geopyxis carbonaria]|nr:hypothetical protein EDC01DRAFT_630909 [Geopyxis carbonaria]